MDVICDTIIVPLQTNDSMMRVVKYDPHCTGKARLKSPPGIRNTYKMRKRFDNQLKSIESSKITSPIVFHHVKVDEMTNSVRQVQILQDAEAHGGDGKKNQQSPLVIKTDPRYNNSQLEISMSHKKLNDSSRNKDKKLTFLPSMSNRLPSETATTAIQGDTESDQFSNFGIIDFKRSHELRNFRHELLGVPSSSLGKEVTDEYSHSRSEMGTSSKSKNRDYLTRSPALGGKFSSDVRLKLNKNNARFQNIQGYSTCTFRVKMNGKNRI